MEQAGEYRVLALPAPNHAVELTAYSVRCAPAFGSSSPLALAGGACRKALTNTED
jgi:hypothetical protein